MRNNGWNENQISELLNNFQKEMWVEIKPVASWSRFWANLIDGMVISIPVVLIAFIWSLITRTNITIGNIENNLVFTIIFLLTHFTYHTFLTTKKGATLGKDAYGLKVVSYGSDNNLSYSKSTLRELVKFGLMIFPILGGLFYLINGLVIIFSKQKRGLHDRVANSLVVKVKPPWNFLKQILFFGGMIIIVAIVLTLRPNFTDKQPARMEPEVKLELSPEDLTPFVDTTHGWKISYDANRINKPFVFNKEALQHAASKPPASMLQKAGFLVKSGVPDFCGSEGVGIEIHDNPDNLTISEWFDQYSHKAFHGSIDSTVQLGSNQAYLAKSVGWSRDRDTYIISKDKLIYLLYYHITDEERDKFPETECLDNEKAIINMFDTFQL